MELTAHGEVKLLARARVPSCLTQAFCFFCPAPDGLRYARGILDFQARTCSGFFKCNIERVKVLFADGGLEDQSNAASL